MLAEQIKKYLGTKYNEQNFNCYTLLVCWFNDLGYKLDNYQDERYWYNHGKNHFLDNYHKQWEKVERDNLKENDIVLMKILSPVPNHCGICVGEGKFIHCYEKTDTVVSRVDRYKKFIHSFYRLKECQ